MKILDIFEGKIKEAVIAFKPKQDAKKNYKKAVEIQNNHTHRADVGIEPCAYCDELNCDFDCDESRAEEVDEARVPGLPYKEKPVSKKDPTIDRVILTLKGKDSEIMTKLGLGYKKLDNLEKMMKKRRDKMNAQVKEKMTELFDAEDEWRTRVIDTVSATMTLAKRGEGTAAQPEKHVTKVDYEQIALEMLSLLEGELLKKGASIVLKYTKFETIPEIPAQEPKSPALRVEPKEKDEPFEESLNEGFNWSALKSWAHNYLEYFKSWGVSYDKKLAAIKAQMGVTESMNEIFSDSVEEPEEDNLDEENFRIGDKIQTKKMATQGFITDIKDEPKWGCPAIYFKVADGRILKTPMTNVIILDENIEMSFGMKSKDLEEDQNESTPEELVAKAINRVKDKARYHSLLKMLNLQPNIHPDGKEYKVPLYSLMMNAYDIAEQHPKEFAKLCDYLKINDVDAIKTS